MKLFALTAFAAAALVASTASAQSQRPQNLGPVIPGVCVFDPQRAVLQSTAGQAVQVRMRSLTQEVAGEISPYYEAVQTGLTSLQQSAPSMTQEQRDGQAQQLQQRYQEAQQLEQMRQGELRYTLSEQLKLIGAAADPIMVAVYQERGCGMLINAESIIEMNPAMDITDTVIQRLNSAYPGSGNFNRLPVPPELQQQQQAQ